MSANIFESAARGRKVDRLVLAVGDLAHRLGCAPTALLPAIERWGNAEWTQLAIDAGQKPPSNVTRGVVLDALRARASEAS